MKKFILFIFIFALGGCMHKPVTLPLVNEEYPVEVEQKENSQVIVTIDGVSFTLKLEENKSAKAFRERLEKEDIVLKMKEYSHFEKVGILEEALISEDEKLNAKPGDLMLYDQDKIVLFYGENTWEYTRLGKIEDVSDLIDVLKQKEEIEVIFHLNSKLPLY